jgi:hypothetical protein
MGGYVGFQPFVVDQANGIIHLHTSTNHATYDSHEKEIIIRAVCERRRDESVREARLRIIEERITAERADWEQACRAGSTLAECRNLPLREQGLDRLRQELMIYAR